ncbi:MAG: type I asparaginase [Sandaracinaceae bacterium]|nr:type I asparaginase [Sandaracinaceae bacterium]
MVPAEPTEPMSRVLVLYTGGTIGMRKNARGVYEPVAGWFAEQIAQQPQLHDPTQPKFTTRPSASGRRIHYDVAAYEVPLDSANLDLSHWARFATDIERAYDDYDAFVVVHGTDTMAYTASALAFMLDGLAKPVILTGAQIPIERLRNDALDNLLGALGIAGHYAIPEVGLYFHHKLLRGCRATKVDAVGLDAFASPNLPPLAEVGVDVKVAWHLVRPAPAGPLRVHTRFDPHVASLRLYPGITRRILENFLAPPLAGLVLESFGAGNAPDRDDDLIGVLRAASERGVVIVNVSQCLKGHVRPSYAAGQALVDAGVVPGADMTPEAALTKLAYLLGQGLPLDEVRALAGRSLRGELTEDP